MTNVREKVTEAVLIFFPGFGCFGSLLFVSLYPEPEWSSFFGHVSKIMRKVFIAFFATAFILYVSLMIIIYTGLIERCQGRRHVTYANVQPFRMFPHYDRPPLPQQVFYNVHGNRVHCARG